DAYLRNGGTVNFSLAAIAWVNELTDPAQRPAARVNPDMLRTAKEVVGIVRGVAVYAETDERTAVVPLLRPLRKGETVTALYTSDDVRKSAPIASGTYTAP
ncbi:MAG: hypothetical protein ACOVKV_03800, partial [Novosphingobium sp.]